MNGVYLLAILAMMLMVYIADRKSAFNRALALAFAFIACSILKVMFRGAVPALQTRYPRLFTDGACSAVFAAIAICANDFSIPAFAMAAIHFNGFFENGRRAIWAARGFLLLTVLVKAVLIPPPLFETEDASAWLVSALVDVPLGAATLGMFFAGFLRERDRKLRRQKKALALVIVAAGGGCLLVVYLPHLFNMRDLFYFWEDYHLVLVGCVAAFIVVAFRVGFIGFQIMPEHFDWSSPTEIADKGALFMRHMLKNQTNKITMSLENLAAYRADGEDREELRAISGALEVLQNVVGAERPAVESQPSAAAANEHRLSRGGAG